MVIFHSFFVCLPFWVAQIGAKKNRMSHRNLDLITEIHPLKKKVTLSKKNGIMNGSSIHKWLMFHRLKMPTSSFLVKQSCDFPSHFGWADGC